METELSKEELELRAREAAQRLLTTPKRAGKKATERAEGARAKGQQERQKEKQSRM